MKTNTLHFTFVWARLSLSVCLVLFLGVGCYLTAWAIRYRMPHAPCKTIDMRRSPTDLPRSVTFCAALADNPIGFPGHAYVVWSKGRIVRLDKDFSLGFMPRYFNDQPKSLIAEVPGIVLKNVKGNTRNLDMLTVIVSDFDFHRSLELAITWQYDSFRAGKRDCVAFTSYVAQSLGLKYHAPSFIYPQDFIHDLKTLN